MSKRVRLTLGSAISTAAVVAFLVVSLMATTAHAFLRRPAPPGAGAAGIQNSSTYSVGYFDTGEGPDTNGSGGGDNVVKLINPTAANGDLCAMIYVFDDDEELGECCGCPLSPNKLLSLSVKTDLTSNWEGNANDFESGVIKIISAVPNNINPLPPGFETCFEGAGCNEGCDPTITYAQTAALDGSIVRASRSIDSAGVTETNMFAEGAPDAAELTNLISTCAGFVKNSSGFGICDCGPEVETDSDTP
jgi:hypothetical protein